MRTNPSSATSIQTQKSDINIFSVKQKLVAVKYRANLSGDLFLQKEVREATLTPGKRT
jgi:hypothetical protein